MRKTMASPMRFYASGIPNGEYEVFANLYDNAAIRYYLWLYGN